jgi:hypothetical protein
MKFNTVLRSLIREASRFEVLMDKFVKPQKGSDKKPLLRKEDLFRLIDADPTTRKNDVDLSDYQISKEDMNRVKVGQYTPWLIKNYLRPKTETQFGDYGYEREVEQMKDRFMEDLYKVTDDLLKFERFKSRLAPELRDINKLTIEQLADAVGRFSLEKTKASKEEKKEASKSYIHPGADIIYRGAEWTVAKISEKGDLGRDAACFYGGNMLKSGKGETNWCTSAPGLEWFNRYINKGPLYVVIPNSPRSFKYPDILSGEVSGLPAERYQFHFPDNQFMDADDRQIDLVKFLNDNEELKDLFKPEFAKGLTVGGEELKIEGFSSGAVGKFIGLYGLDELFDSLPATLKDISIDGRDSNINLVIPPSIGKFKNLQSLFLQSCVEFIPNEVCQLKDLKFISLMKNPRLETLPECLADLPDLLFINVQGCDNLTMPPSIQEKGEEWSPGIWSFS